MTGLAPRPAAQCRYDLVSLGEVMLRLDPGEGRVRTARTFRVWEGGGEYNVARGLRRCFGLRTAVVTAFADNEVGRLLEDLVLQGGVDTSLIRWVPYDGVGRDRAQRPQLHRARLRRPRRRRHLRPRPHRRRPAAPRTTSTGTTCSARWACAGCTPAASTPRCPRRRRRDREAAMSRRAPPRHDRVLRPQLPPQPVEGRRRAGAGAGGQPRGSPDLVDVMIGNEEDFTAALGFAVPGTDDTLSHLDGGELPSDDRRRSSRSTRSFGSSRRPCAPSAAPPSTTGARSPGSTRAGFAEATHRPGLEILDRVGGGDSFASGLIYGLLDARRPGRRGRVRRGARCAGDDDARGHVHGEPGRGGGADGRRRGPRAALEAGR